MTTFRDLQNEVLLIVKGYGLAQSRASYLSADVDGSSTSINVNNADDADQGTAEIDGELISVESVDRSNRVLTLSPDGRGYMGTTAGAHPANTRIDFNPTWPRVRVKSVINDTILSTYPTLFGVGTQQFTFTPSVTTYSLPASAERVLSISADTLGPSREQQAVTRYSFNSVAPSDDWPTGNSVTIQQGVAPGRTVTVTYLASPTVLVNDSDAFTASGLRESAKLAIIYGACSNLLAFMDVARLPADTAQADEYDDRNAVGTATRVANQLYTRFQIEVEQERKRLRQTTPVPVTMRTR